MIAAKTPSVNTKSLINGSQNHYPRENPNAHILFPAPRAMRRSASQRNIAKAGAKAGLGVPTVPDRLILFTLSAFASRRLPPPAVTCEVEEGWGAVTLIDFDLLGTQH